MRFETVEARCVLDDEACAANITAALTRGLRVCGWAPKRTGQLAIVGSAPSVLDHIDELRSWPGEIWAVNGAYRFLLERGIVAHAFIGLDPVPGLKEYVEKRDKRTSFLMATVCDPAVLDELADADLWLWHSRNSKAAQDANAVYVSGGTTCLTRAPFLAHMLGWRDITLYGGDSSFSERAYCYDNRFAEDTDRERFPVEVPGDPRVFITEMNLIKQVPVFGVMQQMFNGLLKFRCGGLLDAYLKSPICEIKDAA